MQSLSKALLTAGLIALAAPVVAQSNDQPQDAGAADSGLSTGTPVEAADGVGTPYMREKSGDWEVRCVRTQDGNDPCQLYQLLTDEGGSSVAEITVFPLPEGGQAVAGATITVRSSGITSCRDSTTTGRRPATSSCAPKRGWCVAWLSLRGGSALVCPP